MQCKMCPNDAGENKTCSKECLSKLRSEISRRNKDRVRWNQRPQERPSKFLEEVAERDYIEGVLR